MRKLLIVLQLILLAILFVQGVVVLFHDFGGDDKIAPLQQPSAQVAPTGMLEQLRTWSDLIVARTLFSPQRGAAQAAAGEAWSNVAPPFTLAAIYSDGAGRAAVFVPAGANPAVSASVTLRTGQALMENVIIREIRTNDVLLQKPDGLYLLRLSRTAGEGALKLQGRE